MPIRNRRNPSLVVAKLGMTFDLTCLAQPTSLPLPSCAIADMTAFARWPASPYLLVFVPSEEEGEEEKVVKTIGFRTLPCRVTITLG